MDLDEEEGRSRRSTPRGRVTVKVEDW